MSRRIVRYALLAAAITAGGALAWLSQTVDYLVVRQIDTPGSQVRRVAVLAPGGCGGVCEGGGPSRESVEDNDALDMRDSVLAVRLISSGGQAACEPI